MTDIPHDIVIFRRWKDTGDVVAIFPALPADEAGRYCQSYDETGQQIAVEYEDIFEDTVGASPTEYSRLAHELAMLGYRLRPVQQATQEMHERRRDAAGTQRGGDDADL